jgi:hypothetical protein
LAAPRRVDEAIKHAKKEVRADAREIERAIGGRQARGHLDGRRLG